MDTQHYFKYTKDGQPYFRIPELEFQPPKLISTVAAETLLQSKFTRQLMEQFSAAYTGKGEHDYDVTLPVNVLAFWDKFDHGILRECARLFPENFREMRILPFATDESQTEYYVNELRIVANEAIYRRTEEVFERRNNGGSTIWNSTGEPTAAFTSKSFEMDLESELLITKPPPGFPALPVPDISRRVIGRERKLWEQQKTSADVLSPRWLPPQSPPVTPQGVFSLWDFPSLPSSNNQQDSRSTRWSTKSQQHDTRRGQGGDGIEHNAWHNAEESNEGWTWPGFDFKGKATMEDIFDKPRPNKFQEMLADLKEDLATFQDSGFSIEKLPDVTSTHQLFSSVDYRDANSLLNLPKPSSKPFLGTSAPPTCDSFGAFNPHIGQYHTYSYKARDNFEDIYGNHTILNSTIGRYEYFTTLRYYQGAQPPFLPPTPPEDLGLEDSYETPIRYTFHTENYDPVTLQPVRYMEPVPSTEYVQTQTASTSSTFQVTESDIDSTLFQFDEECEKIAENILEDSNGSTEENDEYEDYSDEDEEEEDEVDDQPPIIEINCSRYKTFKANASSAGSHRLPSSRRRRNYLCVFCKGNNEPEEIYKSHPIRVNGEVMCPFLRNHICAICKNTGHTIKYCPQNKRGFFAQKALEKSKSQTHTKTSTFNNLEHTLVFTPSNGNGTGTRSRRPSTAPASLPTQNKPHRNYEDRRKQEGFHYENNYRGTVLTAKKSTDQASGSGSGYKSNVHRGSRKGRGGGGRKKRAHNFKSI